MTFTVRVEADAERDWDEAVMWYDERAPGVSHWLNVAIRALTDMPPQAVCKLCA